MLERKKGRERFFRTHVDTLTTQALISAVNYELKFVHKMTNHPHVGQK